ncbi:MAG: sensor histidine kinase [Bacilli bacterium]|jgi:two-component system sensor histidine kinase AgrC
MWAVISKVFCSIILTGFFTIIINDILKQSVTIKNKKVIILLLAVSFITLILYGEKYNFIITLTTFILMVYAYKYIFKITIYESITLVAIVLFLFMMADIVSAIGMVVLKLDINQARTYPVNMVVMNIAVALITYLIISTNTLKEQIRKVLFSINDQNQKTFAILCFMYVVGFGVLYLKLDLKIKATYEFVLNITFIITFLITLIIFLIEKDKYTKLVREYDLLEKYIKDIESWIEKYRLQSHENKNQLLIIKGLVNNQNKKLLAYLKSLFKEAKQLDDNWLKKLSKVPSGGLKGLLYYKINAMLDKKIAVFLDIGQGINPKTLSSLSTKENGSLCKIIGVYLDNAIDAAEKSKAKQISIEMYKKDSEVNIIISNAFNGRINLDRIDEPGFSTKNRRRGYGLALVSAILRSNVIFSHKRTVKKDIYSQELQIKCHI